MLWIALVNLYGALGAVGLGLGLTSESVQPQQTFALKGAYPFLDELYTGPGDLCVRCKQVLRYGTTLTLPKTEIVDLFYYWCTTKLRLSSLLCNVTYTLSTTASTLGTDFTNLLQMMENPEESIDGDYYCHFKAGGACPLPSTPSYDPTGWWPPKPSANELQQRYAYLDTSPGEVFRVAHLSDFHLELGYTVGAEASCNETMCCNTRSRASPNEPVGRSNPIPLYNSSYVDFVFTRGDPVCPQRVVSAPAREFGEYTCDTPELLLNNTLNHVRVTNRNQRLNFEFALFTGDMVDHDDLHHTTINTTLEEEVTGFNDMKAWLGGLPVYSVLGNHDTFPYGQLAPASLPFANQFEWNANHMRHLWADNGWLPSEVSSHYAGYAVITKRGLKIIALNSNVWYVKNMYAYAKMALDPDSFGALRWLSSELAASEALGQRVWIQAHIPFANTDMLPLSLFLLGQLIERFSPHTIAALFFGHTHKDQFQVLYNGLVPVNMAWISPSVTPIFTLNPAWRYYEVDAQTFSIVNAFTYQQQLGSALPGCEPEWELGYSAREAYGNTRAAALRLWGPSAPLNATFWHEVAVQIRTNETFNQLYTNHLFRFSPSTPNCTAGLCGDNFCYVSSFTRDAYTQCQDKEALEYHVVGTFWDR